jgi:hypothetical protein
MKKFNEFIGVVLLLMAAINVFSSIVYGILTQPPDERWFSRFAFAIILLGIWRAGNK